MQRRTFVTGVTATAATLAAPMLRAQSDLPTGPVRIIVGFAPGGGTDILARVIGQKLADDVEHPGHRGEQGRARRA